MKIRVEKILKHPVEGMYIGTFHSIGLRFLRKNSELLGLKSDFTILDKDIMSIEEDEIFKSLLAR